MNNKIRIFFTKLLLHCIMNNPLCTSKIRRFVLVLCGAKIGKGTFIGQNVYFDYLLIQNIEIGNNCIITQNCSLLTHFYSLDKKFYFGTIKIGNNVIIGAGSIITKDIPANSFAAGSPCKIIKEL